MLCGTGWSTRPCTESSSNVDKLSKQEFYDIVNKHRIYVINTWMVAGVAFRVIFGLVCVLILRVTLLVVVSGAGFLVDGVIDSLVDGVILVVTLLVAVTVPGGQVVEQKLEEGCPHSVSCNSNQVMIVVIAPVVVRYK